MERNAIKKHLPALLLLVLCVALVAIGMSTLLGGRVSEVFSDVDYGLDGGSVGSSVPGADRGPVIHDTGRDEPITPGGATRRPEGQPAALKAGEINDNEAFSEYLTYLDNYHSPMSVHLVDVQERYIISVLNDQQQPLYDTSVRVYRGQRQLFAGQTYANGQILFLPGLYGIDVDTRDEKDERYFRVVAERGDSSVETTIDRQRRQQLVELTLEGAKPPAELQLDMLFLLDTTGSMGDELGRIQATIDSIAQRINGFEPRPSIRYGLVAYRDHGSDEAYVTLTYDFIDDLATFQKLLNGLDANGGGDTPEALNEALNQAVEHVSWSDDAVRLIFLVADAGPHIDEPVVQTNANDQYSGEGYIGEARKAIAQGVKIYAIAASNTDTMAEYVFRQLAQQTMGSFIFLTYQSGASGGAPGEYRDDIEAGQQQYTVERLDDLIVQVVERELAQASGL
ncbi:MAG: VWA domain-containing protein [Chloroflexaceae bacterium]|nr:VWA domain-containing protein [Chloroflexaceae bacterium]